MLQIRQRGNDPIRQFGPPVVSAALTNLAVAFPKQKLTYGATIFGALV